MEEDEAVDAVDEVEVEAEEEEEEEEEATVFAVEEEDEEEDEVEEDEAVLRLWVFTLEFAERECSSLTPKAF